MLNNTLSSHLILGLRGVKTISVLSAAVSLKLNNRFIVSNIYTL